MHLFQTLNCVKLLQVTDGKQTFSCAVQSSAPQCFSPFDLPQSVLFQLHSSTLFPTPRAKRQRCVISSCSSQHAWPSCLTSRPSVALQVHRGVAYITWLIWGECHFRNLSSLSLRPSSLGLRSSLFAVGCWLLAVRPSSPFPSSGLRYQHQSHSVSFGATTLHIPRLLAHHY